MFLVIILSLFLFSQESTKKVEEAMVMDVEGIVEVLRINTTYWQKVNEEDFLYTGDIIRTGKKGKAEIVFTDGNIVELTPSSKLKIGKITGNKQELNLNMGGVLIKVKRGEGFQIATRHAVCAVRGTEFAVEVSKDNTHVGVFEGKVSLKHYDARGRLAKRELLLKKRYETIVKMYLPPERPKRLGKRMLLLKKRMKKLRARAKKLRERMKKKLNKRILERKKHILKRRKGEQKKINKYLRKRRKRK